MSTIVLRDDLIVKLREIARRENRAVDDVVAALLVQYETEEDWEASVLDAALGTALKPDGSVDFEQLRAQGLTTTLGELYPEGDAVDET